MYRVIIVAIKLDLCRYSFITEWRSMSPLLVPPPPRSGVVHNQIFLLRGNDNTQWVSPVSLLFADGGASTFCGKSSPGLLLLLPTSRRQLVKTRTTRSCCCSQQGVVMLVFLGSMEALFVVVHSSSRNEVAPKNAVIP